MQPSRTTCVQCSLFTNNNNKNSIVSLHRDLVKDGMLLYRHSARCAKAMHLFLTCNPAYWAFVPMLKQRADDENGSFVMPSTIPMDPTSLSTSNRLQRSDHATGMCMTDLPPLPNTDYTFSLRQCAEQFLLFRPETKRILYNANLDLYDASIVAVRQYSFHFSNICCHILLES
jgi:hypothetical protein